jgi:hypothetical protein
MKRLLTAALALSLAAALAATAFAAKLSSPRSARVGDVVSVTATGVKNGGGYALTLVSDDRPTPRAFCVARIGKRHKPADGRVKLRAKIPRRLTCYEGNGAELGRVSVAAGKYHLIVSVPRGPTGSSGKYSFVRRALTIKR